MARIRTIKPEFFTSLTVASLPIEARLTFIGLWTHVDDEGRCVNDARLVKAAIWPLDDRLTEDVVKDLGALTEASLITQYQAGNRQYLAITNWAEHQRINRASRSNYPGPNDEGSKPLTCGNSAFTESSVSAQGNLREDSLPERKGKERNRERKGTNTCAMTNASEDDDQQPQKQQLDGQPAQPLAGNVIVKPQVDLVSQVDEFDKFWATYPRKVGKVDARNAWLAALKKRDVTAAHLIDAAQQYTAYCQARNVETRYIPHPATWLNRERYDDDLTPPTNRPAMSIVDQRVAAGLAWAAREREKEAQEEAEHSNRTIKELTA